MTTNYCEQCGEELTSKQKNCCSIECRMKRLGQLNRGHSHPNSLETCLKMSQTMKYLYREGILQHPLKGKHLSPEWRAKIGEATKRRWANPESRKRMIEGATSPDCLKRRAKSMLGQKRSTKTKEKVRQNTLRQWRDPRMRERLVHALLHMRSPNGQEVELKQLLDTYFPQEWKYVGNGQLIIAGLCPDFVNVNGRKRIIELFGEYWHSKKNPKFKRSYGEQHRAKIFADFGYEMLVIWASELKDKEGIIEKIDKWQQNEKT